MSRDIDGWIGRAKQLQADIEQSRSIAREVVAEAEQAHELHGTFDDASNKIELLRRETSFNDKLCRSLEQIRSAHAQLRIAQKSAGAGHIEQSLVELQDLELAVEELPQISNTNATDLLRQRMLDLRQSLTRHAEQLWSAAITINNREHLISLKKTVTHGDEEGTFGIEDIARISASLGVLDAHQMDLCRGLQRSIVAPLLARRKTTHGGLSRIDVSGDTLLLRTSEGVGDVLEHLAKMVTFLNDRLPHSMGASLSELLMPTLISRLLSHELSEAIPTALDGSDEHKRLLERVKSFADSLSSTGWTGATDLLEWTNQAAKIWLAKRRETSIGSVQALLNTTLDSKQTVERTETQTVSRGDAIANADGNEEEWDESWGNDEEDTTTARETPHRAVEEEDMSAWDEDEDNTTNSDQPASASRDHHANGNEKGKGDTGAAGGDPDEEADAWGWDEQPSSSAPASPAKPRKEAPKINGHRREGSKSATKELTLRETYTITALPDELCQSIIQLLRDAETLKTPAYASSPAAPAANGLYSIPTLMLAAYRALAPSHYELLPGSNMYLYNDTLRLASSLPDILQSLPQTAAQRTNLATDIATIQSFGRRAYGRAMDAHRTILRDLIDNAQGFAHCTTQPYAAECANAVSATVAHVRAISAEWSSVLSRSALLQSLGSLVGAVVSKMLVDIEEMSDIGDDESKRLRELCLEVMELKALFVQNDGDGEERDCTTLYVRSWTKFQWLAILLESNLADIRWSWVEGGLKADFAMEELVDLMEALFADNEHRRRAIGEVRRG